MALPLTYNVRSLFVRKATTFATAGGIALVVFVLASVMMLVAGIDRAMAMSGSPDVAIVLSQGSDFELSGGIDDSAVNVVSALPEVKKEGNAPLASGEVVVVGLLPKRGTNGMSNVTIRGVTERAVKLRPTHRIVEGREPKPGTSEAAMGRALRGAFAGVELNKGFELTKGRNVQIVGVFEDGGSSQESEIWLDRDFLENAYGRQGLVSSIHVRLSSPGAFDSFKAQVEHDKRLGLAAWRETAYLDHLASGVKPIVSILGGVISFFFAIGAVLGAMVTMYSAVANRTREIGTLRALGFSRPKILVSFLIESVVLAGLGGVIGVGVSLLMKFAKFSVLSTGAWSETTFGFEPTPRIVGIALAFSIGMGLFGGLLPALRASRISPAAAMRVR